MAKQIIKRYPLEGWARALAALAVLIIIAVWVLVAYYYQSSQSIRSALIIVPLVFTLVAAMLLLILRFRYTLVERYPYLINLPSFVYQLGKQGRPDKEGEAISKVFSVYSLLVFLISLMNLVFVYALQQAVKGAFTPLFLVWGMIIVMVFVVLLWYRRIYRQYVR